MRRNAKEKKRRGGRAMTVCDSEVPFRSVLVFARLLACFPCCSLFPMLMLSLRSYAFAMNDSDDMSSTSEVVASERVDVLKSRRRVFVLRVSPRQIRTTATRRNQCHKPHCCYCFPLTSSKEMYCGHWRYRSSGRLRSQVWPRYLTAQVMASQKSLQQ